jgi:hypothetical protein
MEIKNIVLINRDSKQEYRLDDIDELNRFGKHLCHLINISDERNKINVSLFHLLNSLNTPNGAWSLKMPEGIKFIYDTEVWVKGKMLSENGRDATTEHDGTDRAVEDIIEINEVGHPRELLIRRRDQLKKRILQ